MQCLIYSLSTNMAHCTFDILESLSNIQYQVHMLAPSKQSRNNSIYCLNPSPLVNMLQKFVVLVPQRGTLFFRLMDRKNRLNLMHLSRFNSCILLSN